MALCRFSVPLSRTGLAQAAAVMSPDGVDWNFGGKRWINSFGRLLYARPSPTSKLHIARSTSRPWLPIRPP